MIYAVILGAGRKLFDETSEKKVMELVTVKAVGDGVITLVHQPRGARHAD
jgi:hypothetical protein